MNIKVLSFNNGLVLIGEYSKVHDTPFLNKPVMVTMMREPGGATGISISALLGEPDKVFYAADAVCLSWDLPEGEIKNIYIKHTTGLVLLNTPIGRG